MNSRKFTLIRGSTSSPKANRLTKVASFGGIIFDNNLPFRKCSIFDRVRYNTLTNSGKTKKRLLKPNDFQRQATRSLNEFSSLILIDILYPLAFGLFNPSNRISDSNDGIGFGWTAEHMFFLLLQLRDKTLFY